jgi:hypothetical protein
MALIEVARAAPAPLDAATPTRDRYHPVERLFAFRQALFNPDLFKIALVAFNALLEKHRKKAWQNPWQAASNSGKHAIAIG